MATTVRITVLNGPHKGQRFCFRGATHCLLGRADDCFVQLAGEEKDLLISRHHCQLDVNPACILGTFVRDLGSLNGTYINGKRVAPTDQDLADVPLWLARSFPNSAVEDGDIITVGGTSLQIDLVDCPPEGVEQAGGPVWAEAEVAKRDCPIPC